MSRPSVAVALAEARRADERPAGARCLRRERKAPGGVPPGCLVQRGEKRACGRAQPFQACTASVTLCPPKPKLLDSATLIGIGLALLGARSIGVSTDGGTAIADAGGGDDNLAAVN